MADRSDTETADVEPWGEWFAPSRPVSHGEATPTPKIVDFDEAVGSALRAWRGLTINQRDQWERCPWPEAAFIASHIRTFAGGSPVAETPAEPIAGGLASCGRCRWTEPYISIAHGCPEHDDWNDGWDSPREVVRQGDGEDDAEVWIPPSTDCMDHAHAPCPHCGSRVHHHRTGRCGACGRRPAASPAVEGTTPTKFGIPPAGSEHYQEGWRDGYEQNSIDRSRIPWLTPAHPGVARPDETITAVVEAAAAVAASLDGTFGPVGEIIDGLRRQEYPAYLDKDATADLIEALRTANIPGWWRREADSALLAGGDPQ